MIQQVEYIFQTLSSVIARRKGNGSLRYLAKDPISHLKKLELIFEDIWI